MPETKPFFDLMVRIVLYKVHFCDFGSNVNPKSLIPSIVKAKKFNWSPKKDFFTGLDEYIKWFKND